MNKATRLSIVWILSLCGWVCPVSAAEAKAFPIAITNPAEINFDTDHYTVSVVQGWVSQNDSFIQKLLSSNDKLIISVTSNVALFGGDSLTTASLYDNTTIPSKVDRPWGLNPILVENVPADSDSNITMRLTINKSDRLTTVFKSLEASKAGLPTDVLASPWMGYAKALDGIITSVFKTDKDDFPFLWSGSIKNVIGAGPTKMNETYILLLGKEKDSNSDFDGLDGSKFTFVGQVLKYDNKRDALKNRSYVILKISKGAGFNIAQYVQASNDSWAVLARSQFLAFSTLNIKNEDQLTGLAANFLEQLKNLDELLIREKRFSKYDRAVALQGFANSTVAAVNGRCATLGLTGAHCPNVDLVTYASNVGPAHGVPPGKMPQFTADGDAISRFVLGLK